MIKAAFMFSVHSLHLSVEQLLIFWNTEIFFCLIISAFKHHTNTECHFTSSTLSTKITSSTRQKHKNVAPAAVTPLNIFCRERLSHDEDKGRVAVLFYSMAADLAGPFPFPCCSIADPLNSHAGSSRLLPSPLFQLMERTLVQQETAALTILEAGEQVLFTNIMFPAPKRFCTYRSHCFG